MVMAEAAALWRARYFFRLSILSWYVVMSGELGTRAT